MAPTGARIYGSAIATHLIPQCAIDARYMAAYIDTSNPGSLAVVTDPRVKHKVDRSRSSIHAVAAASHLRSVVPSLTDTLRRGLHRFHAV